MANVVVFNTVSLDGFFTDVQGDMSWAHSPDEEWQRFTEENARGGGTLFMGRVTYDLMVRFWPTPAAARSFPAVAELMNSLQKVVFSRTLETVSWKNTRLAKGEPVAEVRKLKQESGNDMVILGSGSVVSQLTDAGLVDEYQFVLYPIILGKGRTMFEGVTKKLALELTRTRSFRNGNVLLCYKPLNA
jgi:dihydrofolate reductase